MFAGVDVSVVCVSLGWGWPCRYIYKYGATEGTVRQIADIQSEEGGGVSFA